MVLSARSSAVNCRIGVLQSSIYPDEELDREAEVSQTWFEQVQNI